MDLQSFIQSGLLESYVLGQATAEERSLVERMLVQHPEARTEMTAIEQAMESYAKAMGTPPPVWMKGRILDQIAQMDAPMPISPAGAPVPAASAGMLRVFQVLALLLLLAGAFLWNRNNQLRGENTEQRVQLDNCNRSVAAKDQLFVMFRDTATKIVKVKNLLGGVENAMVYTNPDLHQVVLNTASVPAPSQENVYFQCWAIVGGVPMDMGMVQKDAADGWQTLRFFEHAVNYAISAENNPRGNPAPTTVVMMSDKI